MTFEQAYRHGESLLAGGGAENAFYESVWLLGGVTGKTVAYILARNDSELTAAQLEEFERGLAQRLQGRPLQYILGKWSFYGRDFYVGEGVLIPRPETEQLVEIAIGLLRGIKNPVIADLCAGTGCIGLTLAREIDGSEVYLAEKYDGAFAYLSKNASGIENAHLIKGDILGDVSALGLPRCDLIVSNPPYIKTSEIPLLQKEVRHEPVTALDAGEDGLMFYRALRDIVSCIRPGAAVFETGEDQTRELTELFPGAQVLEDYSGHDRFLVLKGDIR